jgi:hypothetical protein
VSTSFSSLSILMVAALGVPALAALRHEQPLRGALGQEGNPAEKAPVAQEAAANDLDGALTKLEGAVKSKQLNAEIFDQLRASLEQRPGVTPNDPNSRVVTARLQRFVEGLRERGDAGTLSSKHIDMLREQIIDERLEIAVDKLSEAAQASKATEAEFQAVVAQLTQRAQVSRSYDNKSDEMKSELSRELNVLQQRWKAEGIDRTEVERFRRRATGARIDNAIASLHAQATSNDLTVNDLVRLRGLLDNHAARAADDAEFTALRTKLIENLDTIEGKMRSGALDPEELMRMRENLRSVREASVDKPAEKEKKPTDKPTDKPSEKRDQKPTPEKP